MNNKINILQSKFYNMLNAKPFSMLVIFFFIGFILKFTLLFALSSNINLAQKIYFSFMYAAILIMLMTSIWLTSSLMKYEYEKKEKIYSEKIYIRFCLPF